MKEATRRYLGWVLMCVAAVCSGVFAYETSSLDPAFQGKDTVVKIPRGSGVVDIAAQLKEVGVSRNRTGIILASVLTGTATSLKAGTYELRPSMNAWEIVWIMGRGEVATERVVIKEGWSLREIETLLQGIGFSQEDIQAAFGTPGQTAWEKKQEIANPILETKPVDLSLEGYLFPDTYDIHLDASMQDVALLMVFRMEEKLQPFLAEIQQQGRSVHDVLTVASLLEKEVRTEQDKRMVAGIIEKRISLGMPLQIDATVRYAIGNPYPVVSIDETKTDLPYNTYQKKGLPPGSISNPGTESIDAALHPMPSPYLFYLSAPGGNTIYSKTFEEHKAAKAKYLK